jgi:hypothetical protein
MTDIESCSTCKCYYKMDDRKGQCKRMPPDHTGKFPVMLKSNWCCEHVLQTLNEVSNV